MDPLDLDARPVVLTRDVPIARVLFVTATVLGVGALTLLTFAGKRQDLPLWPTALNLAACTALLTLLRTGLTIDFVLDDEAGTLDSRRRFFGGETRQPVARLDEISAVAVECRRYVSKSRSWLNYRVVLVLADGQRFPVSDATRDCAAANVQATRLASHLGCAVVPGGEGRRLEVEPVEGKEPRVIQAQVEPFHLPPANAPGVVAACLAATFVAGALSYGLAWLY